MPNIYCDSDFAQDVIIQTESGGVQDITDWTFEFLCTPEGPKGCSGQISLSMGNGLSIQDAANGVLRISLTASQTKSFGPGVGRVLLWRTDDGRKIIAEGQVAFEGKRFDA